MSGVKEKLFAEFSEIAREEWEAAIQKDLKGADYNKKLVWKTDENFVVKPYYRAEDTNSLSYLSSLPGQFPYTRGTKADNNWKIVQKIDNPDLTEANAEAKESLTKGANAIIFNASKIKNAEDMKSLLNGLDLSSVYIYFDNSENYSELSKYIPSGIKGAFFFDPIIEMLLMAKFKKNEDADMSDAINVVKETVKNNTEFRAINVRGYIFGNCGSTLIQELAYSLATANEYLAYASEHALSIDEIANNIQFSFSIGSDYFMEIAKLRAARLLWACIVSQYKPEKSDSAKMQILSMASSWNKTMFDAHINILRNTTEGMSAAIGGADAILLNSFNETFENSDEFSRRIARNTQIILKEESHFDKVIDPAAGSYYIENLTDSIAEQAWKIFLEIEKGGGIIKMGLDGEIKKAIEASCQKRDLDIATRRSVILGTNQYPNLGENMSEQVKFKTPVKHYEGLQPYRGSIPFEELRLETEKWAKIHGEKPKVFLFKIGNLAMRTARAGFITNFFGCAGYKIVETSGYSKVAEGIKDVLNSKAEIVAICSSDEEYPEFAPEIISKIKKQSSKTTCIIAGNPSESIDMLKAAGADDFIHVKVNILETLTKYNKLILK